MKRFLFFGALFLIAHSLYGVEEKEVISPRLQALMEKESPEERIRVTIQMSDHIIPIAIEELVAGMGREDRRRIVISELKGFTEESQREVFEYLREEERSGGVRDLRSLWINNTITGKMKKRVIETVSRMEGIAGIDHDPILKMIESRKPVRKIGSRIEDPPKVMSVEWNITRVNALCAWTQGYKGQGIVVGNIDSGVNYNHNDLFSHIWRNMSEFSGSVGVDDDFNGFVDDIYGWDFVNGDGDPIDDHGHGTHTAGTVAGDGTSGDSVGVAPEAQIMSIKVLSSGGSGSWSDVFAAVQYGVDNGADVLTISIGGYSPNYCDPVARSAFDTALLVGVISSVAAGNLGGPGPRIDTPGSVPPPWHHPDQGVLGGLSGVITVGGTTSGVSDAIWSGSSQGPTTCWGDYPFPYLIDPDVVAPGACVTSLRYWDNTGYEPCWSGTSMATPHVAGLVALLLSKNPSLSPAVLDSIIEMTAVDRGASGKDTIYGSGRIDCCAAINAVVSVEESTKDDERSMQFALFQSLPNPFHNSTTIHFSLPTDGIVSLRIYDITGRLVRTLINEKKNTGVNEVLWDGKDGENQKVSSGVYFYQLEAQNLRTTKRFILLR